MGSFDQEEPGPRRPPRRRTRDEVSARPPREEPKASAPSAEEGPSVRAFRAPPRPAAPGPAPAEPAVGPRLDPNDLLAITQMDPADLAALMEGSLRQNRVDVGSRISGSVARVGRDTVFVDLGGKSEGQLERHELPDAKLGDAVTAYVVGIDEGTVSLSLTLSGRAAAEHLEEARLSGVPVEGKVVSRNTGGFEVRIGTARAFCPLSMISRLPEVDMDAYVGQTLSFRVIETGEKVVVNRRVLQEEEVQKRADEVWTGLAVGQQHRGTIRNVQPFGFFVDIGGVEGLVPKREISWKSVDDPRTLVRVGQSVEVVILVIDHDKRQLTLSAKALEDDPWSSLQVAFHEGGIYEGTVVRAETFGVFVELAPGLDGLVHQSKLVGTSPAIGTPIHVRLLSIDAERRRLELAPVAAGEQATPEAGETRLRGTVAEVVRNGVVVQLDDGRTGWIPENEVDLPAGTVLAQRFRRGKPIEARLIRDDPRRPTLSMRESANEEERTWQIHRAQSSPSGNKNASKGGSFGTLGDLLGNWKPK